MQTWKIQINGLVQGVGFRPLVSREAEAMDIKGWVSNTTEWKLYLTQQNS
jgi:hydrogenase maturation protein HypF